MYLNASFLPTSVVISVIFKEAAENCVLVRSWYSAQAAPRGCSYLFRAEDTSHSAE